MRAYSNRNFLIRNKQEVIFFIPNSCAMTKLLISGFLYRPLSKIPEDLLGGIHTDMHTYTRRIPFAVRNRVLRSDLHEIVSGTATSNAMKSDDAN